MWVTIFIFKLYYRILTKTLFSVDPKVTMEPGSMMVPELYGCDGSKYSNLSACVNWHDDEYISSTACSVNIELEHAELPEGFGVRVGPADNITQLLFCNHYHDHHNLYDVITYRSEESTLKFSLEKDTTENQIKAVGTIFLATISGHIETRDGFLVRLSHKFNESAVIRPLFIRIHMHAFAHYADRAVAWFQSGSSQQLIANSSVYGKSDHFPDVLEGALTIRESDVVTVECYFRQEANKTHQEIR